MNIAWPERIGWHLGVSGTRRRYVGDGLYPTWESVQTLHRLIVEAVAHGAESLHHGCCTGWDEAAVRICRANNLNLLIHAHPPIKDDHLSRLALAGSHVVYKRKGYRERDQDIARISHVLLAGPAWPEDDPRSKHSGTWMTTRLSRASGAVVYACDMQGNVTDVTEKI